MTSASELTAERPVALPLDPADQRRSEPVRSAKPPLRPPDFLKRSARVVLGENGYNKLRFVGRDWLQGYLPRYLKRREELRTDTLGQLEDLFVFLTNQCNARCSHCFYIDELGYVPGEMRLEDYQRLAPTLPKGMTRMTFTGGEAILHPDCEAIIAALSHAARPESIVIITNGFVPSRVERICRALLDEHKIPSRVDVLVSMDGMEETHNKVRGNPKAWDRANETLQRLSKLKAERGGRFDLGVITIIQDANYREIEQLNNHLLATTHARHGFEFLRGTSFSLWNLHQDYATDYNPAGAALPPEEEWDNILATLQRINRRAGIANHAFQVTNYMTVEMLRTQRKVVDCVSAGENVGVIYPTGEVALCEFSKAVGKLQDFDYDFEMVWRSHQANQMRGATRNCFCTHGCYLSKNIEYTATGQLAMLRKL